MFKLLISALHNTQYF